MSAESSTVMLEPYIHPELPELPGLPPLADLPVIAPPPAQGRAMHRRPTALMRRSIQALTRSMRFCLIRNLAGEYRFIDVSIDNPAVPPAQVEFMLYLTEGRTCAEIIRALPTATKACLFDARFGEELIEYFDRLGQMLKYNNESFVLNEPGPDSRLDDKPNAPCRIACSTSVSIRRISSAVAARR